MGERDSKLCGWVTSYCEGEGYCMFASCSAILHVHDLPQGQCTHPHSYATHIYKIERGGFVSEGLEKNPL